MMDAVLARPQSDATVARRRVVAWALWDWATQPFATVITTFVFTVFLTSELFIDPEVAALGTGDPRYDSALAGLSAGLGFAIAIAGALIAVLAPIIGQRSDASGRRKRWLAINTGLVILTMTLMFFVEASPSFFVLGVALVALGNVFAELAGVNYNAMLVQVSTPKSIGRISGLGWGFGYLGGIAVLALVVVAAQNDWFGIPTDGGLNIRMVALACAVWAAVFVLPIFLAVPEFPAQKRSRPSFLRSYVILARDVISLYRNERPTFWFLIASAAYRDGLAGIFTFGGLIAAVTFGFTTQQVVIFGIGASIVAGISTIVAGRFDDRFGGRTVIMFALSGLIIVGLALFFLRDAGPTAFWIGGLLLSSFVGPAQSASRSFLARMTPAGREGEIFGLYATTGRAASFLSPALWAVLIAMFGAQYWGILGLLLVLALGLGLLFLVKPDRASASPG